MLVGNVLGLLAVIFSVSADEEITTTAFENEVPEANDQNSLLDEVNDVPTALNSSTERLGTYLDPVQLEESPEELIPTIDIEKENVDKKNEYPLTMNRIDEPTLKDPVGRSGFQSFFPVFDQYGSSNSEDLCQNADFLVKILNIILPLLARNVPGPAKIVYVVQILKELLKNSPQSIQDDEVLNKMHDLLLTLEKYDLGTNNNAVGEIGNAPTHGLNSKMSFKFEIPMMSNPDCTAELLNIIKVVQGAISRLVDNPVCKVKAKNAVLPEYQVNSILTNPVKHLIIKELFPYTTYDHNTDLPDNTSPTVIDLDSHQNADVTPNWASKVIQQNVPFLDELTVHPNDDVYVEKFPLILDHNQSKDLPLISPELLPTYDDSNIYYIHNQLSDIPYHYDALPSTLPVINGIHDNRIPSSKDTPVYPGFTPIDSKEPAIWSQQPGKVTDIPYIETIQYEKDRLYPIYDVKNKPLYPFNPKPIDETHWKPSDVLPELDIYQDKVTQPVEVYPGTIDDNSLLPKNDTEPTTQPTYRPIDQTTQHELDILVPEEDHIIYDEKYPLLPTYDESPQVNPIHPEMPDRIDNPLYPDQESEDIYPIPYHDVIDVPYYPKIPVSPQEHKQTDFEIWPGERPINIEKNPWLPKYDKGPNSQPYVPGVPALPYNPKNPDSPDINNVYPWKPERPEFDIFVPIENEKTYPWLPESNNYPNFEPIVPEKPQVYPWTPNKAELNVKSPQYFPEDHIYQWRPSQSEFDIFVPEGNKEHKPWLPVHDKKPNHKPRYPGNNNLPPIYPWRPEQSEFDGIYPTNPQIKPIQNFESDISVITQKVIPSDIIEVPQVLPSEVTVPASVDQNVLLVIKDNIGLLEHQVPQILLNVDVLQYLKKIKHLISLQSISIQDYATIINQYEQLIAYIKKLNISNDILKKLLLTITNSDKTVHSGKSNIIELTYLVKRPTPVVYQPYYYVKYRVPYTSFLSKVRKVLTEKPYLRSDPVSLYKELISLSNIAETSPDLKNYGKESIFNLTYINGTLLGAEVVKANDADMYATIDLLKQLNSDMTLDEAMQVMENVYKDTLYDEQKVTLNEEYGNSNKELVNTGADDSGMSSHQIISEVLKQVHSLRKDNDVSLTLDAKEAGNEATLGFGNTLNGFTATTPNVVSKDSVNEEVDFNNQNLNLTETNAIRTDAKGINVSLNYDYSPLNPKNENDYEIVSNNIKDSNNLNTQRQSLLGSTVLPNVSSRGNFINQIPWQSYLQEKLVSATVDTQNNANPTLNQNSISSANIYGPNVVKYHYKIQGPPIVYHSTVKGPTVYRESYPMVQNQPVYLPYVNPGQYIG